MDDLKKRLSKGFMIALLAHLSAAAAVGFIGYSFVSKPPYILEVDLVGGGSSAAAQQEEQTVQETTVEEPVVTPQVDDIVDEKIPPKPEIKKPQPKKQAKTDTKGSDNSVKGSSSQEGSGGSGDNAGAGEGGFSGEKSGHGVPVVPPRLLTSTKPKYPASARDQGIEGVVYVKMLVGIDGKVEEAFVVKTSGNEAMDNSALIAVRKWRFSPSKDKYGQKARCYVTQGVRFDLKF